MLIKGGYARACQIDRVSTCDFSTLQALNNDDILIRAKADKASGKLLRFITETMGIENRYFVKEGMDALDLARQALVHLLEMEPSLVDEADAFILAGISNPLPTVCQAALLAGEFQFKKVSCWDLKSGCSTGVLGMLQALDWFQHGAQKVVLVCTETFSRFSDPETLQMSASTGDGACAISLSASDQWKVLGAVHGSDPAYLKTMYVPGRYPVDMAQYKASDYVFHFESKNDTLEKLAHHWVSSLQDLLRISGVQGSQVTHYVSHQVDGKKNKQIAMSVGIPVAAIHLNFAKFGNMGCPTLFINYAHQIQDAGVTYKSGDVLVLHAVGGGLTWAGLCLQKI